jgi:hypothetical protein
MKTAEEELDGDAVHNFFFQRRNVAQTVDLWEYSRGM